jgi:hypothetical protein
VQVLSDFDEIDTPWLLNGRQPILMVKATNFNGANGFRNPKSGRVNLVVII